jgi:photosystem II stability/assembly factor-like uncharacterized protein
VCLSPNGVDTYFTQQPPDKLLIATLNGVVRLSRAADARHWTVDLRALLDLHVSSMMREPGRGLVFAGIHGAGLYRSGDEGVSWEPSMKGLRHEHVFSVAFVRNVNGVELYAGTEPPHLYRSRDAGDTWEEVMALRSVPGREKWNFPAPPHIAHVKHVAFDPRDSRRMYVCIEQGALLRSDDGGSSFRELHFQESAFKLNRDTHRIVFNPRNPDEIYLDGGDGICRSPDGGETWQRIATPAMRVAYPDHLYYSPEEQDVLFVAGGGTPPNIWRQTGDARSAIARSADGGRTWTQLQGGLPSELPGNIEAVTMVVWPGGFGFFAGTTDGEVFCSFDRGESWTLIADGIPPVSKCVHHRNLVMGRAYVRQLSEAGSARG